MKYIKVQQMLLLLLLNFCMLNYSFAWDHSIEIGYGKSHDPNHTKYDNSGVLLNGDIFPLKRNSWSFWSINGAVGQWYTTSPQNKNLTTAALSLALRLYTFNLNHVYPVYLLGSAGPAYLSKEKFGLNTQASHLTIQTILGLGTEFKNVDVNFHLVHYSNANLGSPNEGFNVLYMLSVGYLF